MLHQVPLTAKVKCRQCLLLRLAGKVCKISQVLGYELSVYYKFSTVAIYEIVLSRGVSPVDTITFWSRVGPRMYMYTCMWAKPAGM